MDQDQTTEPDAFLQKFTGATGLKEAKFQDWWQIFTYKFWATSVIDPYGRFYFYWSGINMCAVVYNGLFLFLRASFTMPPRFVPMWYVFDHLADIIYLTDMVVRSRRAFYEKGLLVTDVKRLLRRYVKSYLFFVDCVTILPTDIAYTFKISEFHAYHRVNRAGRIRRMFHFFSMAEGRSNFPNIVRVVNLLIFVLIIIHCNACIYYSISVSYGLNSDSWVYPSRGFQHYTDGRLDDVFFQYLFCFYWSTLTLTTIGDTHHPVKPLQTTYCIVCSLMGVFIFATVFGNVGAMINNIGIKRTEYKNTVKNIKQYMDSNKIPDSVQKRIVNWLWYTWKNKQSVDDVEVLQHLPEKMRAEMGVCVHINTLRGVKMFKYCESGLLEELVLKLNLRVFSPGDFICRRGDVGREMYIVKQGYLHVLRDDGTVLVKLAEGQMFGEISVLEIPGNTVSNRRTADVKAVGFVDLLCLSKRDLSKALENYPKAKEILVEKGKDILRKEGTLNEEEMRKVEELPSDRLLIHRTHVSLQGQKLMLTLQNIHITKFDLAAETDDILASITKRAAASCLGPSKTFTDGYSLNKTGRTMQEIRSAEWTDKMYSAEHSAVQRCRLNRSSPMSSVGKAASSASDLKPSDNVSDHMITPSSRSSVQSAETPVSDHVITPSSGSSIGSAETPVYDGDASDEGVDYRPGLTPSKLRSNSRSGQPAWSQDNVRQRSVPFVGGQRSTIADDAVRSVSSAESSFVSLSGISCHVEEPEAGRSGTKIYQTDSSTDTEHPNVSTTHSRDERSVASRKEISSMPSNRQRFHDMQQPGGSTRTGLRSKSDSHTVLIHADVEDSDDTVVELDMAGAERDSTERLAGIGQARQQWSSSSGGVLIDESIEVETEETTEQDQVGFGHLVTELL